MWKWLVATFNQEKALVGAFSVVLQLQTSRRFLSSSSHHAWHGKKVFIEISKWFSSSYVSPSHQQQCWLCPFMLYRPNEDIKMRHQHHGMASVLSSSVSNNRNNKLLFSLQKLTFLWEKYSWKMPPESSALFTQVKKGAKSFGCFPFDSYIHIGFWKKIIRTGT